MQRLMAAVLTCFIALSCAPGEQLRLPDPPAAVIAATALAPSALPATPAADPPLPPLDRAPGATIALPFQETFYLPDSLTAPLAYHFPLGAGEELWVTLETPARQPPLLDVFQQDSAGGYRPVASVRGSSAGFHFEAQAAGQYVLRIRPRAGGGGRYHLTLGASGELTFPVAGGGLDWVRGRFGDARDGGARGHEGIDIFAPRGTPVIAVEASVVSKVETTGTGGRVIWCEDEGRGLTYFYAHLERQLVSVGDRVAAGDTIGTVGNTGNARGSSPHLHFAAYRPGLVPVDPTPLLESDGPASAEPPPDSAVHSLGTQARTRARSVRLRAGPEREATVLAELGEGTVVHLLGAVAEWRHVQLTNGGTGFIASWLLEPVVGTR